LYSLLVIVRFLFYVIHQSIHQLIRFLFQTDQQFTPEIPEGTCRFNEELVGMFAKEIGRENIIIATKFFPRREQFRSGPYQYSYELLLKETENSLQRLGIECIDIYYLHRMYPEDVVSIETIASDMKKLVDAVSRKKRMII